MAVAYYVLTDMKSARGGVRGRPREFDADKALDAAMRVFWEKGYDGASLSDLTKAMGISKPSMYLSLGNKEALFDKAMERYAEMRAELLRESFTAVTVREGINRLLCAAVEMLQTTKIRAVALQIRAYPVARPGRLDSGAMSNRCVTRSSSR